MSERNWQRARVRRPRGHTYRPDSELDVRHVWTRTTYHVHRVSRRLTSWRTTAHQRTGRKPLKCVCLSETNQSLGSRDIPADVRLPKCRACRSSDILTDIPADSSADVPNILGHELRPVRRRSVETRQGRLTNGGSSDRRTPRFGAVYATVQQFRLSVWTSGNPSTIESPRSE